LPCQKSIAEITSEKVRALHTWWASSAGIARVSDRGEFQPAAFSRLLPNMLISEVTTDPFRIRYRLIGTKVADVLSIDITGRYLDELVDGSSDTPWLDYYAHSYHHRQAVMGAATEPTTAGDTFTYEFGIFPVTAGGTEVRQFMCIEDYFDFNRTSAELFPWSLRAGALRAS